MKRVAIAALVAVLAGGCSFNSDEPTPVPTQSGMDAAMACSVFFQHIETNTPMSTDTGWDIAGAWLHSDNDNLYKAAFVLFDGTPDVDAAMPYITSGCAQT